MEKVLALIIIGTAFLQGGFFPSVFLIGGIVSSVAALIFAKRKFMRGEIALCFFSLIYLIASLINGYSASSFAQACLPASCVSALYVFTGLQPQKRQRLFEILLWCSAVFAGIGLAALSEVLAIPGAVTAHRLQYPFQYANAAGSWYAAIALLCLQEENKASKYVQTPILTALLLTRSLGALGMYGICLISYLLLQRKKAEWGKIVLRNALAVPFAAALFFINGWPAIPVILAVFAFGRYQEWIVEKAHRIHFHWICIIGGTACVIPVVQSDRVADGMRTFTERICQIIDGLKIITLHPLSGVGAGNWQYIYPYDQSAEYVTTVIHSSPIQIGVDSGILAILAAIWLLYRLWKSGKRPLPVTLASVLLLGHSLLDFTLEFYPICLLLLFLLSFGAQKPETEENKMVPRAVCAGVLLLCLTMCWCEQQYKQMVYSTQRGAWEDVIVRYEQNERIFGNSSEQIVCAAGAAYRMGEYEKANELCKKLVWLNTDGIVLRSRCLYKTQGEDAACAFLFSELERRDHQRYFYETARYVLASWELTKEHKDMFNDIISQSISKNTYFDREIFGRAMTGIEKLE